MDSQTQLVKFDVTPEAIRAEVAKYSALTADTPAGYEEVRLAIAYCRTTRVRIESRRVELKADALAYGRAVDATAKELTAILETAETPLRLRKADVDAEKERVKLEREAAERKIVEDRIRAEREAVEAAQRAEREAAEVIAKAERDAEAERNRVESARLAEERRVLAAERSAADEAQRIEREAIAKARADIEREQREVAMQQEIAAQAERNRLAVEQAKADTAARIERERVAAEEARAAEELRAAEHAAMLAELRPDLVRLAEYAAEVLAVPVPKLRAKRARALCADAVSGITAAVEALRGKL